MSVNDRSIIRRTRLRTICATVLCGCALACAAEPDATQRFQEGWRPGHVRSVGTAAQLSESASLDCRKSADHQAADELFAVVSYSRGRTKRTAVVPVKAGTNLAEGQAVWVQTRRCEPVEPR
jgi:hypothetical protein